jgi:hypothetical protein
MFVYCTECGYDSGDYEDQDSLAQAVKEDGGGFKSSDQGLDITCPQGHKDSVHLD